MIRIHDTLQRRKVDLEPIDPQHVRMYACGPTVYNLLHIGNARPLVVFDVVYRHLRTRFPKVTYVRNITDVDDKIIQRAAEKGEEPQALAARFAGEFHRDVASLCCLAPDIEPKVTDHMDAIVDHVARIVERGAGYVVDGDVYFDVPRCSGYGRLSGQPLDQLEAGARVEVNERKRSVLDFALWKAAKPGEPSWPSPWGLGRPGWHIECSAMSTHYLGDSFDIHGGGVDLVFPHHENECAQAQAACGEGTFARHWLHNGFVNFNDKKISKSDVNMRRLLETAFLIRRLVERHSGETLRYFLLTPQYRHPINFEVAEADADADRGAEGDVAGDGEREALQFPGLEDADRQLEYGYLTRRRIAGALAAGKPVAADGPVVEGADTWLGDLLDALDDDFNTAAALASLQKGLTLANRILDGGVAAPKDVRRRSIGRIGADLTTASAVLGLLEAEPAEWLAEYRARRAAQRRLSPESIEQRIAERDAARAARAFARADAGRAELRGVGVELMDGPAGTDWRIGD